MRKIHTVVLCVLALCFQTASTVAQSEISIDGSTTVGPIVDAFVGAFQERHPELRFSVKKTGSGDGITALIDGRADIAASSRFLRPEEYNRAVAAGKMPVTFTIALDSVCLIVHPSNPVRALTKEQAKKIYTGEFTNWQQVGGPSLPIIAISRDTASGTYEVFHELAMDKERLGSRIELATSNPQIVTRVSTTQGAIGYVGLGFVLDGVQAVRYEGVMPTRASIANGTYKLSRPLYLFTEGYPELGSALLRFCNFFLTEEGHDIIGAKGFIPLTSY
jgi:phosphate transport system substrate-binding protein